MSGDKTTLRLFVLTLADTLGCELEDVPDCIESLAADAEVGRLLREVRERWPGHDLSLHHTDGAGWSARAAHPIDNRLRASRGHGPTPAAALRALLGEEGGQHGA